MKRAQNEVPKAVVLLCAPSWLSRGAKHSPLELCLSKRSLRLSVVGGPFLPLRTHRTPQQSLGMARKSEHYHGKVHWTCRSRSRGPWAQERQGRAPNVLRMRFQMPRRTFSCLRGLAVVRSTLPWNFCLRSGPYAYLWSEAYFYFLEPTELHSKALEWF